MSGLTNGLLAMVMRDRPVDPVDEVEEYFNDSRAASFEVHTRRGERCEVKLTAGEPGKLSFDGEAYVVRRGDVLVKRKQQAAVTLLYNGRTRQITISRYLQELTLK